MELLIELNFVVGQGTFIFSLDYRYFICWTEKKLGRMHLSEFRQTKIYFNQQYR